MPSIDDNLTPISVDDFPGRKTEIKRKDADDPSLSTGMSSSNDSSLNLEFPSSLSASSDLPFLVTHWLAGYKPPSLPQSNIKNDPKEAEAIQKIHRAAADLASAFSMLNAFELNHGVCENQNEQAVSLKFI